MLRKAFEDKGKKDLETEPEFRYRGSGNSRIENLSDAVFGFGITLLIVSLQVPNSFEELKALFDGFFAFGIAVMLFFGLWYEHYIFFIRYGLKDRTTVILNGILLFVLLFFIYPLKFLVSIFIEVLKAGWAYLVGGEPMAVIQRMTEQMIGSTEVPELMIVYGLGGAGVYGLFALLYFNAYRRREELDLDATETDLTRLSMSRNAFSASVPLLSAILAFSIEPAPLAAMAAGMIYALMGFMAVFGTKEKRIKRKALERRRD
jgi:uncharacterized membrane protein